MTMEAREFPGGPVVRIPCSHCWGPDSIPGGESPHLTDGYTEGQGVSASSGVELKRPRSF